MVAEEWIMKNTWSALLCGLQVVELPRHLLFKGLEWLQLAWAKFFDSTSKQASSESRVSLERSSLLTSRFRYRFAENIGKFSYCVGITSLVIMVLLRWPYLVYRVLCNQSHLNEEFLIFAITYFGFVWHETWVVCRLRFELSLICVFIHNMNSYQ